MSWGKEKLGSLIFAVLVLLTASLGLSVATSAASLALCLALALVDGAWPPRLGWRRTPLDEPLSLLLAITLLSTLFALDPARSFKALRSAWIFSVFYLYVWYARDERKLRRLIWVLLGVGATVSVWAVIQHYTGIALLGRPVPTPEAIAGGASRFIATGTFSHHQTFSNVYFMIFCLAFSLAISSPGLGRLRGAAIASGGALGLAVAFSYTRGVWLATLAALLVIGWLRSRRAFLVCLAALALLAAALAVVPSGLSSRARSIISLRSNIDRLIIWETSWAMLRDHPALGIGQGNYSGLQKEYLPPGTDVPISRSHAHNTYLQLALERGLFALVAFGWMWYVILRLAFSSLRFLRGREDFRLAAVRGATGGVLGFLIDGLFQNNFGDSEVTAMLLFLVALIVVLRVKQAEREAGPAVAGGVNAAAQG